MTNWLLKFQSVAITLHIHSMPEFKLRGSKKVKFEIQRSCLRKVERFLSTKRNIYLLYLRMFCGFYHDDAIELHSCYDALLRSHLGRNRHTLVLHKICSFYDVIGLISIKFSPRIKKSLSQKFEQTTVHYISLVARHFNQNETTLAALRA